MPIKAGENPEGHPVWNKYIARGSDGVNYGTRGMLLAVSPDRLQAAIEGEEGQLLLVREPAEGQWPVVESEMASTLDLPHDWLMEGPLALSADEDKLIMMLRRPGGAIIVHVGGLLAMKLVELPVPDAVPPGYVPVGLGKRLPMAGAALFQVGRMS